MNTLGRSRTRFFGTLTLLVAWTFSSGMAPASVRELSNLGATGLGAMQWSFLAHGPVRSSPVVAGDLVLVASTDGSLYGLEIDSGREAWRYDAGASIASTPVVAGNSAYLVDRANQIHAVDLVSGRATWKRETGSDLPLVWGLEGWDYVTASPVVVGDTLYVGSGDGAVYALRAADGELLWRRQTAGRIRATPTIDGSVLYVGDGDGVFHALDAASGESLWSFETDGHGLESAPAGFDRRSIYSPAAVHDGNVYFGGRDAQVYALDAATGAPRWQTDDGTSGWVMAAPVVDQGRLVVTRSSSTRVRALDLASGQEVWSAQTGAPNFAPVVSMAHGMLAVTGSGLMIAYDTNGHEVWRYGVGAAIWSAPAQADGTLYVGSDDGMVRAFGLRQETTPTLHVFADEGLARTSILGSRPAHAVVADYFRARGYQPLDAESLPELLEARIADREPSVVVFAIDNAPERVVAGGDRSLLRRFLMAGGRLVWLGHAPGIWELDEAGTPVGLNRSGPEELLGVDHSNYNTDRYGVWPTAEGRRRGLRSHWVAGPRIVESAGVEVLGRSELGAAVAWTRAYGDAGGSFVALYPATDSRRLDEIRAVAEYGIYQSPSALRHEASLPH